MGVQRSERFKSISIGFYSLRISIISLHHKLPNWVNDAIVNYQKRISHPFKLDFITIPLNKIKTSGNVAQQKQREAEAILKQIKPGQVCIALDENGKMLCTQQFAKQLQTWQQQSSEACFIIGGPDGLHNSVLKRADFCWSLSALTFPHPLVQVILSEQIYRGISVLNNHPYHRD